MNHTHTLSLFILILLYPCYSHSQDFHFPVNPGQKSLLAGSVGEIRSSHFHTGLDIAVQTNTKVYASAEGYVSRIKVSAYGYGKVLYITHPLTKHQTVYAHLNAFEGKIADYIINAQYKEESFDIELFPEPDELPVKKGELIAFSGNTGASGGPHLHYEIRTLDDIALNPMNFGFKEIPVDNIPPLLQKIALLSLDIDARVENKFGRTEYPLIKYGTNTYKTAKVIPVYGEIGLELLTHDISNGSFFRYGTTNVALWLDGKKIYAHDLNQISHDYNRCMNVHVNYEIHKKTGQGFQRCYIADGNKLDNYEHAGNKGKIKIDDDKVHDVKIIASDPHGNKSFLNFQIKGQKPSVTTVWLDKSPVKSTITYQISENTLIIKANRLKKQITEAALSFNATLLSVVAVIIPAPTV